MKSCAVLAIGKILLKYGSNINKEFIIEINTLVLLLIKDKNREVYLSILSFYKVYHLISDINLYY